MMATRLCPSATYHKKAERPGWTPTVESMAGRSVENKMLWTITVVLVILWLIGFIGFPTLGSWIHILLVLAVIVLIFNLLSGRRAL